MFVLHEASNLRWHGRVSKRIIPIKNKKCLTLVLFLHTGALLTPPIAELSSCFDLCMYSLLRPFACLSICAPADDPAEDDVLEKLKYTSGRVMAYPAKRFMEEGTRAKNRYPGEA